MHFTSNILVKVEDERYPLSVCLTAHGQQFAAKRRVKLVQSDPIGESTIEITEVQWAKIKDIIDGFLTLKPNIKLPSITPLGHETSHES